MAKPVLSRRALLAGLGGAALTLPMLEVFNEREARAATAPLRYLVVFAGMSTGREDTNGSLLRPTSLGAGYGVTEALQPLVARGVKDQVTVLSDLRMDRRDTVPGAAGHEWHTSSVGPMLCGVRADRLGGSPHAKEASSDQIVADAWANKTPIRGLHYRVQSSAYRGSESRGQISYQKVGGQLQAIEPTVNAKLAYQALLTKVMREDPAEQARAQKEVALRRSALVSVKDKAGLLGRLGKSDRQRLEQHFDELSRFEQGLAGPGGACKLPGMPNDATEIVDNYSNEKERAPLLSDLIKMSFACDLTRVATLMVTYPQSFLGTKHLIPSTSNTDCHETSHQFPLQWFTEVLAWHVDVFADLVAKLKSTPDVDGKTLLDNTAVVYLFEGGQGFDSESGGQQSSHSSEKMVAFAAGRAAGKKPGQHVQATGKHPASLVLSAMQSVGLPNTSIGEINTSLTELA